MRRRRWLAFVAGPLTISVMSACAMVADLGDRTLGPLDGGAKPSSTPSGTTTTTAPTATTPPSTLPETSTGTPSYCTGITLYASFDTKLTGDVGGQVTENKGGVTASPQGKFGAGLSLVHIAATPDDGAAVYFLNGASGNPWPDDVGSFAVWYHQAPGTSWGSIPLAPILYRPMASAPGAQLLTAGLAFYLFDDTDRSAGLYQMVVAANPQQAILTTAIDPMLPFLRGDYNHYFTSWQRTAAPTASFALNGGLGVRTDNQVVAPPAPVAGELRSPFKSYTSAAWTSQGPSVGFRLGGLGSNSPDGVFDDLVIWNRVVSFEEVAQLYQSNKSVGAACHIGGQ